MNRTNNEIRQVVLVEGPTWGDADFYGRWLVSAATAQLMLHREQQINPSFRETMSNIEILFLIDLGIMAAFFVSQLQDQRTTFVVDIESEDLIEFVLMERMGFFEKTEDRFRMVIPKNLGIDAVKAAVSDLASTDDDEWIHPERLVVSMTYHNAKKTQAYLRDLDDMRRLSHRFES